MAVDPAMNSPLQSAPQVEAYISAEDLTTLIHRVKAEDIGPDGLDITSRCVTPEDLHTEAVIRSRRAGVLAGAALLPAVVKAYDPAVRIEAIGDDGVKIKPGQVIAKLTGRLRSILALERVALNFLIHLSGVATLTRRFVDAAAGSKARIYDTRKTLPGLRGLQKYAVACGGGCNHRMGLYDAMLIKDNHFAHVPARSLPEVLEAAIRRAKATVPAPKFVELEVDSIGQLETVLRSPVGAQLDVVLLDNMTLEHTRMAAELRDKLAPQLQLEASGGVTVEVVGELAATGVDRIAIGAVTHSARALDIGLDIPIPDKMLA